MKKIAFYTLGCKVNQYETEAISNLFEEDAYEIVDFNDVADVYLINTCTVTNSGDKKSRQMIRRADKKNKNAIIVVCGCFSQTKTQEVLDIEGVNIVLGTSNRDKLVSLVNNYDKNVGKLNLVKDLSEDKKIEQFKLKLISGRTRAFVKIQDGCRQFCTYCIIPYARGKILSRTIEDVKNEIKDLVDKSYKEIVLTGIHIASYGKDLDKTNLLRLLEEIHDIEGLKRIRFSSMEPNLMQEDFVRELANFDKVCNHFHLSLQSASDNILTMMNRKYDSKFYYERIEIIKKYFKDVAFTTDIIVGFPGESEDDFMDSFKFIEKCAFSKVHIFPYSAKTGTKAASFENQINALTKKDRVKRITKLSDRLEKDFIKSYIGKELEVLFEDEKNGFYEGYSNNYIKIRTKSDENIKNKILNVQVKEYKNTDAIAEIIN